MDRQDKGYGDTTIADDDATDEVDDEKTEVAWVPGAEVAWTPRKSPKTRRGRRSPFVALAVVAAMIATLVVALVMLLSRPPASPESGNNEDPLALYQVATELYAQGEHRAALQMVERAREVTQHARAHRLLNALKQRIDETLEQQADRAAANDGSSSGEVAQESLGKREHGAQSEETVKGDKASASTPRGRTNLGERRAQGDARRLVRVRVESEAIGDVFVDRAPTGARTPAVLELRPGLHVIEVVPLLDPSQRMKRRVKVQPNRPLVIEMSLEQSQASPPAKRKKPKTDVSAPSERGAAPSSSVPQSNDSEKPAIGVLGDS
jgi:hypothetical protein